MLDALMGPSRNQEKKDDKGKPDFADDKVCKNFLVGFCPHDWFTQTRRKMPPCNKIHSETLKEQFEAHPKVDKYRREYDTQFLMYLERVAAECDAYTARERIKCRPKGSGGIVLRMPPEIREKYDALQGDHAKLVKSAEEIADESVSKSQEFTQRALEVEDQLEILKKRYEFEFPGEEVCEICGVRYAKQGEHDTEWHDKAAHLNGKQHQGWVVLRDKIDELRAKMREYEKQDHRERKEKEERREKEREKDKEKDRDRDRDRDRDKDKKRDDRKRSRDRDRDRDRDKDKKDRDRDSDRKDKDKDREKEREREKQREREKDKKRRSDGNDRSSSRNRKSRHS